MHAVGIVDGFDLKKAIALVKPADVHLGENSLLPADGDPVRDLAHFLLRGVELAAGERLDFGRYVFEEFGVVVLPDPSGRTLRKIRPEDGDTVPELAGFDSRSRHGLTGW